MSERRIDSISTSRPSLQNCITTKIKTVPKWRLIVPPRWWLSLRSRELDYVSLKHFVLNKLEAITVNGVLRDRYRFPSHPDIYLSCT